MEPPSSVKAPVHRQTLQLPLKEMLCPGPLPPSSIMKGLRGQTSPSSLHKETLSTVLPTEGHHTFTLMSPQK